MASGGVRGWQAGMATLQGDQGAELEAVLAARRRAAAEVAAALSSSGIPAQPDWCHAGAM